MLSSVLLIQMTEPTNAPTPRNNQRIVKLSTANGSAVAAARKQYMVTGKKTVSNRHRQARTTSMAIIAPR
jgi:hypothetical protein